MVIIFFIITKNAFNININAFLNPRLNINNQRLEQTKKKKKNKKKSEQNRKNEQKQTKKTKLETK